MIEDVQKCSKIVGESHTETAGYSCCERRWSARLQKNSRQALPSGRGEAVSVKAVPDPARKVVHQELPESQTSHGSGGGQRNKGVGGSGHGKVED